MDPKERSLVASLVERVQSLTFGEHDVMLLLISLRAHAQGKAPLVKELGNFIAHRAKDQGLLLDFMKQVQESLQPGAKRKRSRFTAPLSVRALHRQLAALLHDLRLPPLTLEHTECLVVVSSTVLDQVQFHESGTPSLRPRYLQFGYSAHLAGLFGVVPLPSVSVSFPVMAVVNRFFESPFPDHPDECWFPDRGFIVSSVVREGAIGFYQEPATKRSSGADPL